MARCRWGGAIVSNKIHEVFMQGPEHAIELFSRQHLFGASARLRRGPRHARSLSRRGPVSSARRNSSAFWKRLSTRSRARPMSSTSGIAASPPESRSCPTRARPVAAASRPSARAFHDHDLVVRVGRRHHRAGARAHRDRRRHRPDGRRRSRRPHAAQLEGFAPMRVGVPKEIKNHEYRVGMTPPRRARADLARPRRLRGDQCGRGHRPCMTRCMSARARRYSRPQTMCSPSPT